MLNLPTNIPLYFVAVRQMVVEGQSDKMASDMEVCIKQRGGNWIPPCEKNSTQQWQQWQWVTSTSADVYKHEMQALVHCWWRCIANGGDCVEKVLCSWEFTLSSTVIVLLVSIVVYMEINRRHYFQRYLYMYFLLLREEILGSLWLTLQKWLWMTQRKSERF